MADNKRKASNKGTSLLLPADAFKGVSQDVNKTGQSASGVFTGVKSGLGKFYKSLPDIGLEKTYRQPSVRTTITSPAKGIQQTFKQSPDIGYSAGVEAAKRKLGGAIRSAIQDTSSAAQSAYRNSPSIGLEGTLSSLPDQMTAPPVKEFQGPIQRPAPMSDIWYLPRDVYNGVSAGLTREVKGARQGLSDVRDNSIFGYSPDRGYGRETAIQGIRRGLGGLSEYTGGGKFAQSLYSQLPSFGPSRFAVRQPPQQRGPYGDTTNYAPSGVAENEPAGSGMEDFQMSNMPNRQRNASGSSAIGWEPPQQQMRGASGSSAIGREPQQRGNIFNGLAPGRNGGGIGGGQYVPTVGIVPNNPRNAQFAPQFRESAFNSRQMDLNSQMRNDAFMAGINQKRKVYGKFGQDQNATPFDIAANNQLIDNAVAANQQQVGRNFMSARDKAMISRPMGGQQEQRSGYGDTNPINGRGIEGFIPSGNMVKPQERINPVTGKPQLFLTTLNGGRSNFFEGNEYASEDAAGNEIPGKSTQVYRTPTGGLGLRGTYDPANPSNRMTDQSRAAANQRRDARIIGNQIKYGLSPETPAVARALGAAGTKRAGIERMNRQRQDLEDLQHETTLEHFRSIKDPLARRSAIEKHLGGQGLPITVPSGRGSFSTDAFTGPQTGRINR